MNDSTYARARAFLYRSARPLDIARFQYHFEQGSLEAVLNALSSYQNADGGFGHALEADAWNPNSAPIQTWTATEILREIGFTDVNHPIIQGILRYLAGGKDFSGRLWHNTVKSNNNYPHAPWWHTESDSASNSDYNPTACLAGFILRFAKPGSDLFRLGRRIAKEAYGSYMAGELLADMHTATCYIRLMEYAEEAGVTDVFDIPALKEKLKRQVKQSITHNTAEWETGYVCKPSQFINGTGCAFYSDNEETAGYECDFIIRTQLDDGSWDIPWRWSDYPEEWAVSKIWWKGNGAILNLLFLKGMGMLRAHGSNPPLRNNNPVVQIYDAEQKMNIAEKILMALPDWFGVPENTQKYISDSAGQPFWAYMENGEPIGFITFSNTSGCTAELHVMGVLPQFHRRGAGRMLFNALYDYCRRERYEFLQVKTVDAGHYEEYDRTRLFYESMGFRKFEVYPALWDEWNPCLVMVMAVK